MERAFSPYDVLGVAGPGPLAQAGMGPGRWPYEIGIWERVSNRAYLDYGTTMR